MKNRNTYITILVLIMIVGAVAAMLRFRSDSQAPQDQVQSQSVTEAAKDVPADPVLKETGPGRQIPDEPTQSDLDAGSQERILAAKKEELASLREKPNQRTSEIYKNKGEDLLYQRKAGSKGQEDPPALAKVSPYLYQKKSGISDSSAPSSFPRYDKEGRILARIKYNPGEISKEDIESLAAASGGGIYAHSPDNGLLEVYLPQDSLTDWNDYEWVKRIEPVGPAIAHTGSVTTEADVKLGVAAARQNYGVDGSGVKIGVISDGVDSLAQSQASNDLPPGVTVISTSGWSGDEGTAMLEIVHDLAPGAELYFHDGGSATRFITAVDAFIANGCDIIVDDIGYFLEPFYDDGMVAQKVADAISQGVVFVSAAGNFADRHIDVNWRSTHDDPDDLNFNELVSGTPALVFPDDSEQIVFGLGPQHCAYLWLQWTEKFGQAGRDYDIYVYDFDEYLNYLDDLIDYYNWLKYGYWTDDYGYIWYFEPDVLVPLPVNKSEYIQNGNDDPLEYLQGCNFDYSLTKWFVLVVEGSSNPSTSDRLKMVVGDYGYTEAINIPGDKATPERSIFGHSAVPGNIAVGAINVNDPGLDTIEAYSSRGPSYVPLSSNPTRQKPDICAVDGVTVTGAGGFSSPFFGTSAAAPHVAAIAALIKDYNPSLTGPDIYSALTSTATDLGASGRDTVFGFGRINIQSALIAAMPATLQNAISILQLITNKAVDVQHIPDVNNDGWIGPAEVFWILQKVTGLRQ